MTRRRNLIIPVACLLACSLLMGCAETTRYRVLSFFFDGVPLPPSMQPEQPQLAEGDAPGDSIVGAETEPQARVVAVKAIRVHPPYTNFRCAACHDLDSGSIRGTPQTGMCKQCHAKLTDEFRYVHGPVAVDDCLFCHHHHGGQFRHMLRADAAEICLSCHDKDDLTEGDHHQGNEEGIEKQSCIGCHHGHGGQDRFFLKPIAP